MKNNYPSCLGKLARPNKEKVETRDGCFTSSKQLDMMIFFRVCDGFVVLAMFFFFPRCV